LGFAGGEESQRWGNSPERASGRNSGACRPEVEDSGLEVDPGPDAELLHGSGRARRRRCSVAAARRRSRV